MQSDSTTEADRIAVNNLFKEIAEYGRQVRERRAAEKAVAQEENKKSSNPQSAVNETAKPA